MLVMVRLAFGDDVLRCELRSNFLARQSFLGEADEAMEPIHFVLSISHSLHASSPHADAVNQIEAA